MDHNDVIKYLINNGWKPSRSGRDWVAIYRSPGEEGERAEVHIPLEKNISDYEMAMEFVVSDIALHERRSVKDILSDCDRYRAGP